MSTKKMPTKPMSEARKAYLSAIGKARWAAMPRDGVCRRCGIAIVLPYTFCRDCWQNIPGEKRDVILSAMVSGVTIANQPDPAYWAAIEDACK